MHIGIPHQPTQVEAADCLHGIWEIMKPDASIDQVLKELDLGEN
jgi:hypothetical protein